MAIEENKVVAIDYTLTDNESGEQLDSSEGQEALEFITGKGQIIQGLEEKISTMNDGDKAEVVIEPALAYGEIDENAMDVVPVEQFAGIDLEEGMSLYGNGEDGQTIQVKVVSFDEKNVKIDYNHPLAGKTLKFVFSIVSLRDATDEEIETGVVGGLAAFGGGCGCGDGSCDS